MADEEEAGGAQANANRVYLRADGGMRNRCPASRNVQSHLAWRHVRQLFEGEAERENAMMERGKRYVRQEDMSPDGALGVLIQEDGDVIVWIDRASEEQSRRPGPPSVDVEFCSIGAGGGRSRHTRAALIRLAEAIELDNTKRPIATVP